MSVKIHIGDCRDIMKGMKAGSVHCVITSPPYWGLRDYGTDPTIWGGDGDCDHVWGDESTTTAGRNDSGESRPNFHGQAVGYGGDRIASQGQFCQLCNAWRGNLGLEPTPQLFVDHLVEVMRGVWRVLRDDGLLFLNLGDSYATSQAGNTTWGDGVGSNSHYEDGSIGLPKRGIPAGLKPKDLCGIPWLVSEALLKDGWYRRSAAPWIKANCMPESVRDRPTTAHEYVFMFSKSRRYFYDAEAIKVASTGQLGQAANFARTTKDHLIPNQAEKQHRKNRETTIDNGKRNRRTSDTFNESLELRIEQQRAYLAHLEHVRDNGGMLLSENGMPTALLVNTASYKGAHFATFPLKLVEPLIACGTSEKGRCPECGSPWERVTRSDWVKDDNGLGIGTKTKDLEAHARGKTSSFRTGGHNVQKTTGWQPTCDCYDDRYRSDFPQSKNARKRYQRHVSGDWFRRVRKRPGRDNWIVAACTVFDPFGGSGTTALQADRMGRDAVIGELNETYATDLAYERIAGDAPMFADVEILTYEQMANLMPDVEILTKLEEAKQ